MHIRIYACKLGTCSEDRYSLWHRTRRMTGESQSYCKLAQGRGRRGPTALKLPFALYALRSLCRAFLITVRLSSFSRSLACPQLAFPLARVHPGRFLPPVGGHRKYELPACSCLDYIIHRNLPNWDKRLARRFLLDTRRIESFVRQAHRLESVERWYIVSS